MAGQKKMQRAADISEAVVQALSLATGTQTPNGEDLLPPELQQKYLDAKKKLRRKPSGK